MPRPKAAATTEMSNLPRPTGPWGTPPAGTTHWTASRQATPNGKR